LIVFLGLFWRWMLQSEDWIMAKLECAYYDALDAMADGISSRVLENGLPMDKD